MAMDAKFEAFWQQVNHPHRSQEDQSNSQQLLAECERFTGIASSLLAQKAQLEEAAEHNTTHREFVSGSRYLHRGFYCPSLIADKVIGNTRRGKRLKRLTAACKPSDEYGFDGEGRLLWHKSYDDGSVRATEYLVYEGNAVYGLTISSGGHVETITEELFCDGRLLRFSNCLCDDSHGNILCIQLEQEQYFYGQKNLCRWQRIFIPRERSGEPVYQTETFDF